MLAWTNLQMYLYKKVMELYLMYNMLTLIVVNV
jgi:hypothetical protein